MMLLSENGASLLGGHSETSHTVGSHLLLLRKVAAKVVRPGSDQGSRYTDEDRSEETEDRALIPAITFFCWPRRRFYNNSLTKPDPCFSYKSLALQDYNNKAPDDELQC